MGYFRHRRSPTLVECLVMAVPLGVMVPQGITVVPGREFAVTLGFTIFFVSLVLIGWVANRIVPLVLVLVALGAWRVGRSIVMFFKRAQNTNTTLSSNGTDSSAQELPPRG